MVENQRQEHISINEMLQDGGLNVKELKQLKDYLTDLEDIKEFISKDFKKELQNLKKNIENGKVSLPTGIDSNLIMVHINNIIGDEIIENEANDDLEEKSIKNTVEKGKDRFENLSKDIEQFRNEIKELINPDKYTFVILGENFVVRVDNGLMKDILDTDNPYVLYEIVSKGLGKTDKIQTLTDILHTNQGIIMDKLGIINESSIGALLRLSQLGGDIKVVSPEHTSSMGYAALRTITLNLYDPNIGEIEQNEEFKDKLEEYTKNLKELNEELIENYNLENHVSFYWNKFNELIKSIDDFNDVSNIDKLKQYSILVSFLQENGYVNDLNNITLSDLSRLQSINEVKFKTEFKEYIKTHSIDSFVVLQGNFVFDEKNFKEAAKNNLLVKGMVDGKEIYMEVSKLSEKDKSAVLESLGIKENDLQKLDGTTITLEDENIVRIKDGQIYILRVGDGSGDYGKLVEIKTDLKNKLTSENAKLVYVALGSSLLTAGLIKGLPKINVDFPKIDWPKVRVDLPKIKFSGVDVPNTVISGVGSYIITSFILNNKIADLKDENEKLQTANIVKEIAKIHGIELENKEISKDIYVKVADIERKYVGRSLIGNRDILNADNGYIVDYNKNPFVIKKGGVEYNIKYIILDENGNVKQIVGTYDKGILQKEKSFNTKTFDELFGLTKEKSKNDKSLYEEDKEIKKEQTDNKESKESATKEFLKDKIDNIAKKLEDVGSWLGKTTFTEFKDGKYIFDVKGAGTGDIILDSSGRLISTKYENMTSEVNFNSSPEEIAKVIKEFGDEIYDKYKEELSKEDDNLRGF